MTTQHVMSSNGDNEVTVALLVKMLAEREQTISKLVKENDTLRAIVEKTQGYKASARATDAACKPATKIANKKVVDSDVAKKQAVTRAVLAWCKANNHPRMMYACETALSNGGYIGDKKIAWCKEHGYNG